MRACVLLLCEENYLVVDCCSLLTSNRQKLKWTKVNRKKKIKKLSQSLQEYSIYSIQVLYTGSRGGRKKRNKRLYKFYQYCCQSSCWVICLEIPPRKAISSVEWYPRRGGRCILCQYRGHRRGLSCSLSESHSPTTQKWRRHRCYLHDRITGWAADDE